MLSDKYTTVNIRDYFQNEGGEIGEQALEKMLSNFSCNLLHIWFFQKWMPL